MRRFRQDVSLYEGNQAKIDCFIRTLHIGDVFRGKDFIERLYGYLPERHVLGKRIAFPRPGLRKEIDRAPDFILIEINRLFAESFRQAGYFTIPQWVEFGSEVIQDRNLRYSSARKSLKCDLKKIGNSEFQVDVSKNPGDFCLFYEKMYKPHVSKRFHDNLILKPKNHLKKTFSKGFLLLVKYDRIPIAGALVRIDEDTVTETALGVLEGKDDLLNRGVSGILDYHLHEWAANNNMRYLNLGHTRPFPLDGSFFNKRKWLMSVNPDNDGVMDMAFRINKNNIEISTILKEYPFVFQSKSGLGILCFHSGVDKAGIGEVKMLWRRFWTKGINYLIILSPKGYEKNTVSFAKNQYGSSVLLFSDIGEAVDFQRNASAIA